MKRDRDMPQGNNLHNEKTEIEIDKAYNQK